MRLTSEFHATCTCGRAIIRIEAGKFMCECGRPQEIIWDAPYLALDGNHPEGSHA